MEKLRLMLMSLPSRSTATLEDESPTSSDAVEERRIITLVVLWCLEPWRLGEVMMLPDDASGPSVLGRGSARDGDPGPRVQFARGPRPEIGTGLPIEIPQISRVQALLQVRKQADEIDVRNIGRAGLLLNGSPVSACQAREGDLLQFGRQLLLLCVHRKSTVMPDSAYPEHPYGQPDAFGIVGESPAIWRLRRQLAFVAPRKGHVLIHGPSGSGKELAAHAIHGLSRDRTKPMVARNASTLPEGIIDAELFGNVKNYPNPGMPERPGLVGQADGSALYLDEFAELPAASQTHLLRVLDHGDYQRLGEAAARRSAFRLIGATNRPTTAIQEDLLARFSFRLEIPDLNQRREDIPFLTLHLLRTFAQDDPTIASRFFPSGGHGEPLPRISMTLLRSLVMHRYRTNVRELATMLWSSIQGSDGNVIQALPMVPESSEPDPHGPVSGIADSAAADELEPEKIRAALERHNGHIEATWRALGLKNRYVLRRLLAKYGIEIQRRVNES